jgi:hypothetical protein
MLHKTSFPFFNQLRVRPNLDKQSYESFASLDWDAKEWEQKEMASSLSQRIAEHVKTKKLSATGKNRAAFLAVREEIKGALDDGWPIKTIWETLHEEGKIEFGYDAFIRHVNRLIGPKLQAQPAGMSLPTPAATDKSKVETGVRRGASPEIPGFNFNPCLKPEDLF